MTSLGTLLIQRLDAALGTALSRQADLIHGNRNAVNQPAQTDRSEAARLPTTRHPRETIDRAAAQTGKNTRSAPGRQVASAGPQASGQATSTAQATSSATTVLGSTARIILALLTHYTPGSSAAAGRQPLISTPPGTAPATTTSTASMGQLAPQAPVSSSIASILGQSIQQSGLFYESHLQGVMRGEYPLAALLREPQARLLPQPTHGRPATPSPTQTPAPPGASGQAATATTTDSSLTAPTPGVDPATHGLVRQQLEALADQTIQWRGEAWPDAPMDWRIERDQQDQAGSQPDEAEHDQWHSNLTLQLPGLGDIEVRLRVRGSRIDINLQAGASASADLMKQHTHELQQQLTDRQLELGSLQVGLLAQQEDNTVPDQDADS